MGGCRLDGGLVALAEGVRKSFDGVLVLDGVSLRVGAGEAVGVVGPNGAGKTTLLRIVAGLLEPDSGAVCTRGRPGYVPQDNLLLPWLTLRQNIELPLRIAGVRGAERRRAVEEAARLLGITEYLDRRPREVSGGTARKAAIARALVMSPELLLLDEPYTGLDVSSLRGLQEKLKELKERGVAMIIVSHQLQELLEVADRIYILSHRPARVKKVVEARATMGDLVL